MSKVLLIVPEVLASEQFEGCLVVSHRNRWPMMSDVPRGLQAAAYSFIAVTCATAADSVRQMLKALTSMEPIDRRIVYAEDALPTGLRDVFTKSLCSLLQRVLPHDLMCISTRIAEESAASDSFCATVLRGDFSTACLSLEPRIERFPEAGPRRETSDCGLSAGMLISAVNHALAGGRISGSERKCITSGILLLWDFLNASHEISQTMEGEGNPRTADYWHGIMHRREPDAGNAAYWFRRVGSHPAFNSLASNVDRWMQETGASEDERALVRRKVITNGSLDPFSVIELSTQALRKPGQIEDSTLRRIQYLEMLNLLAWSIETIATIS